MMETWRRVVIGSAVVMIVLGLAILEILSERVRVDEPAPAVTDPADTPAQRWQDFRNTEGDLLNLALGPAARWAATETDWAAPGSRTSKPETDRISGANAISGESSAQRLAKLGMAQAAMLDRIRITIWTSYRTVTRVTIRLPER